MKAAIFIMALLIIGVMSIFHFPRYKSTAWSEKTAKPVLTEPAAPAKPPRLAGFSQWPLRFEANLGQTASPVKFISRGSGYTMYLTVTEVVLAFSKSIALNTSEVRGPKSVGPRLFASIFQPLGLQRAISNQQLATNDQQLATRNQQQVTRSLRFRFAGANFNPEMTGMEELPGKSNYFIGNDPQQWRTDVPHYAKVACREIYPGIDLVFYGNERQLEYDFVVSPGANPNDIRMVFAGADELSLDEDGNLIMRLAEDEIRLLAPIAYQQHNDVRQPIASWFVLQDDDQVGFQVAAYDTSRALVIDPILSYSTYAGGSQVDEARSIATDRFGNVYVVGYTGSFSFPTTSSGKDTSYNGGASDVFVIKLDNKCNLRYSTFFGGKGADFGEGIAVDGNDNVYLTGYTDSDSTSFPIMGSPPYQKTMKGKFDVFVAKLDSSGKNLRYSTYLGGSDFDVAYDIAVDKAGNAYVTGYTRSKNFPTKQADDDSLEALRDAFVTGLKANGSELLYSTYLGGKKDDDGKNITTDQTGNVYVIGNTKSGNLLTKNALYGSPRVRLVDTVDVFVAKYKKNGDALELNFLTYLGGSSDEYSAGIAVDGAENIYVTGYTSSFIDFMPDHIDKVPTARFGTSLASGSDIFVTKLYRVSSTYDAEYLAFLGGSGTDEAGGIALDNANNVYLVGTTLSTDFKTVSAVQDTSSGARDAIVAKLDHTGQKLIHSTYFGGTGNELGNGIALDVSGNVYVCGRASDKIPTTTKAIRRNHGGGGQDAFIIKLQSAAPALISPSDGATDQQIPITLSWNAIDEAMTYRLEVSTNANFIPAIFDTTITNISRQVGSLANNTRYYWRVRAEQGGAQSEFSPIRSFMTKASKWVSMPTPISFPPNPTTTDYQLFSVPGVSLLTVGDIIKSGKQKIDWRLYRDNGEAADYLKELAARDNLGAGEGYWLLKKDQLDFAPRDLKMPALDTDATYAITLHRGWNIIANPFDQEVAWQAVVNANGLNPIADSLYEYSGANGYRKSSRLQPFKGYYFFKRENLPLFALKIPYPFSGTNANMPVVAAPKVDWKVQLIFNSGINRDAENYFGIAPQSRVDWDALDSRKPPLFLDQGFLYFARPEWDHKYSRFSADFRPALGEGQVWEFEVSNPRLSQGKIQFRDIEKIPPEYEVRLINLLNPAPIDLRTQNEFAYQTVAAKMPFRLMVGKRAFVERETSAPVPAQLELAQNFPNPFSPHGRETFGNPATSITFKLPQTAQVRLEVISILGQRVKILAEGVFAPAVYTRLWDGADQAGNPAAAGVYFYRLLNNGKIVQTRKMVLTK